MNVFNDIIIWAKQRSLVAFNVHPQMTKLTEEQGELARAVLRYDKKQIKDSIGDCVVVLTIIALQYGLKIEDCIEHAYKEIKDRKGKTVNGTFIKRVK